MATSDMPAISKDEKIELLANALNDINIIICGVGAPLGSEEYFAIRFECTEALKECGIKIQ